jgi:hypothetical protein
MGIPIYAEARAYAPNRKFAAYVNLRVGGVLGLGRGKMVETNMDTYGYKLTNVDRLGGPYSAFGVGFSWRRLDAGCMFGVVYGTFHKETTQLVGIPPSWILRRKAYPSVTVSVSYSLPISRPPYNKVVTRH